jgi:hypothetical protein
MDGWRLPASPTYVRTSSCAVHKEAVERAMQMWNSSGSAPICARTPEQLATFFEGLRILEPGIVTCSQ